MISPTDIELQCGACGFRMWRTYGTVLSGCARCHNAAALRETGRYMSTTLSMPPQGNVGTHGRGKGPRKTSQHTTDMEVFHLLIADDQTREKWAS